MLDKKFVIKGAYDEVDDLPKLKRVLGKDAVSLGHGIRGKVMELTPEIAAEWLRTRHRPNRKIRDLVVERYSSDARDQNWLLAPSPVAFDEKGYIFDGQHRCQMVIETGVTILVVVLEGFSVDAFEVTDRGASRSHTDATGYGTKHCTVAYALCGSRGCRHRTTMSTHEMERVLEVYGREIDIAVRALFYGPGKHVRGVVMGWVGGLLACALVNGEEPERITELGHILRTGVPMHGTADLAALKMRDILITEPPQDCKSAAGQRRLQNAIKKFCEYRPIKALRVPEESPYTWPDIPSVEDVEAHRGKR